MRQQSYLDLPTFLGKFKLIKSLNLNQRLEYLTLAVANARSATASTNTYARELIDELPDNLDVTY